MDNEVQGIEKKLYEILKYRSGIDFEKNDDIKNSEIFGSKINIPIREMVLVVLDIESKFNMHIPKETIINGKFRTYNDILECIEKNL